MSPSYERAVRAIEEALCECGHRYLIHDPEDARCDAGIGVAPFGDCPCRCFRAPGPDLTIAEYLVANAFGEVETPSPEPPAEDETVAMLNRHQAAGQFHPFTCAHDSATLVAGYDRGALVWTCPTCGQHSFISAATLGTVASVAPLRPVPEETQ